MPIRFQVDPDFYDHPKTLGMSDAATALWVRAGSYSAAKLTDGFVAEAALALLSQTPVEAARELTRRGLWLRVRGGYRFHQWDARNLSRARVEAEKEADRERKRLERLKAKQNGKPQVEGESVRPDSELDSERSPPGVRPMSVSGSVSGSESVSGRGAASPLPPLGPEPQRQCAEHRDDPDPPACRRCQVARERNEVWRAERRRLLDAAPKCPQHPGELAHNCRLCRAERLGAA